MKAREIPLTRAQIQEIVDEAIDQDRDVEEYFRGKVSELNLPVTVILNDEEVNTVDYLAGDLPSYRRKEKDG